ncbi:MAG: SGNH/GDSL hydrolase family protein, partial [Clostridiales bacterium]|nr:SGNH/GDSL hydrolase family protein [Clostridiales bacterium]
LYYSLPQVTGADYSFTDTIKTLEGLDFDKIDVITILYGPSDYLNGKLVSNPGDAKDIASYSGALSQGINLLQEAYPHIRILFVSPNYCMTTDENGEPVSSDLYSNAYGRLVDYMIAGKNVAVEYNFNFLDNYWGLGINSANYKEYLEDNELYPNAAGRTLVAQRIANVIGVPDTQTVAE